MHCKACERSVVKALYKLKGVERILTDMKQNKVVVTGRVEPEKVLKRVKKKTGKRAEIVSKDASKDKSDGEDSKSGVEDKGLNVHHVLFDDLVERSMLTMFNEENPNACRIM
ncbi:heavy metal-associated isoprenylated plant protein 19-like [Tasmannia lanceolata]|uniref:heavy metal-associated isoprenylated plant protein 19-like n=1 Tax=Tasmannia lanceolata TaxID=3420 RepID=UPI0040638BB5